MTNWASVGPAGRSPCVPAPLRRRGSPRSGARREARIRPIVSEPDRSWPAVGHLSGVDRHASATDGPSPNHLLHDRRNCGRSKAALRESNGATRVREAERDEAPPLDPVANQGMEALRMEKSGGDLLSQGISPQVPSALAVFTSVFGMGTGVTPPLWPPETCISLLFLLSTPIPPPPSGELLEFQKNSRASTSYLAREQEDPKPSAD
jgi:hypothetical protein